MWHISLNSDYDAEQFAGNHTPLLVIGTKLDQLDSTRQNSLQMSQIAEECLADEINLVSVSNQPCEIALYIPPHHISGTNVSLLVEGCSFGEHWVPFKSEHENVSLRLAWFKF